jgi:hypothetical protein
MKPVSFTRGILAAISERAHAPGSPIKVTIELPDGPLAIDSRSIGSKRRDDGSYDVRMRLINLRREDRERLERQLAPASAATPTDRSDSRD